MEEIEEVAMETTTERNNDVPRAGEDRPTLMKKKLDELPGNAFEDRPVTIFRLPPWFSEINRDLCEPRIVSIGPYHHGKKSLRAMEEHKWLVLRDFLAHNKNVDLDVYFQAMRSIAAQARQCYSETVDMESDDFVMKLLLDGSFILEWFLKHKLWKVHDVIWDVGWAIGDTFCDFCLMENQLPFFIIHELSAIQDGGRKCNQDSEDTCPLLKLLADVLNHLCSHPLLKLFTRMSYPHCNCIDHLLHLLYKGMMTDIQPQPQRKQGYSAIRKLHNFCRCKGFPWPKFLSKSINVVPHQRRIVYNISCVSELHDAGVKFKRNKKPNNMFDISFENGTIRMPVLPLDPIKARIILNMAAFEQTKYHAFPQNLSSYLALMDSLINTEKDVAVLERSGTIENYFQNAEDLATFFNQFGRVFGLDYSHHYYDWLYKEVKEYSKSTWHAYRARLMQDYFSNPWSIISVVAAAILLILTILQTYYSAK